MIKKRTLFWVSLLVAIPTYANAPANEDVSPMVQEEFKKAHAEITAEWKRVSSKVADLLKARSKAIEDSKKKAETQKSQVELLKKYSLLLGTRYRNERGEYDKGMEVTLKDADNLNKMFRSFLNWAPVQGRVSVGEARRQIDWGVARLSDLMKSNAEPTENNNSDLELIMHQMKELEVGKLKVETMAKALDIPLDGSKSKKSSTSDEERSTASEED